MPGKVDGNTLFVKWRPEVTHRSSLADRIGGYKGGLNARILRHDVSGLLEPAAHIIDVTGALPHRAKDRQLFCGLFFGALLGANKGRITHDVAELFVRYHLRPRQGQGVTFLDVDIGGEREKFELMLDDLASLLNHLTFSNPQGGFGYGDGKVIDLDAIELVDAHLDRV